MKVFFATDIHGSEICWRKFLNAAAFYKADMVILGGDVTGKVMVPIVSSSRRATGRSRSAASESSWTPRPSWTTSSARSATAGTTRP